MYNFKRKFLPSVAETTCKKRADTKRRQTNILKVSPLQAIHSIPVSKQQQAVLELYGVGNKVDGDDDDDYDDNINNDNNNNNSNNLPKIGCVLSA